jgi:RNA recognition motif-containing protein
MAAVGNIRMGTGPDGRSKGFCHVDFNSDEGAKAVFEGLHHQEIEGRRVHIDEATRRLQPQNKSY